MNKDGVNRVFDRGTVLDRKASARLFEILSERRGPSEAMLGMMRDYDQAIADGTLITDAGRPVSFRPTGYAGGTRQNEGQPR